ncbi:MAG TPA: hypothetical protein VEX35_02430 [Allosphingosinicella sp.]|nr:hypothetical protein [Allosphingosinicella sp.]
MSLSCPEGKHVALPRPIRNQGFDFGRCRRCGRDMVRSSRAWRAVPDGFQVVWRRGAGPQAPPSAAQLLLDLPASGRALAISAAPLKRRRRTAAAAELLALGARALAWAIADRVRVWLRELRAPPIAARPVLGLTAA